VVKGEGIADCGNNQHIDGTSQRPKEIMDDGSFKEKQKGIHIRGEFNKVPSIEQLLKGIGYRYMPAKLCTSNQAVHPLSTSLFPKS